MKVVILAGGLGTRLIEDTKKIPKPMVKIGNKPILWNIIKFYRSFGSKEFIVGSGYKSEIIERYFKNKTLDANVDIKKLISHHVRNKKLATISIVRPPARWGAVKLKNNNVNSFEEKNSKNEGWVNGGFMVCEPEIFKHFNKKSSCVLEKSVFNSLIRERNLSAFQYHDFWQCMDTLREEEFLNEMWKKNKAKWKIWN